MERWNGIGKLIEETGEVLQIAGKLIAFPTGPHPDGKGVLAVRLTSELADTLAAIDYLIEHNHLPLEQIQARRAHKLAIFREWGLSGLHRPNPQPSQSVPQEPSDASHTR